MTNVLLFGSGALILFSVVYFFFGLVRGSTNGPAGIARPFSITHLGPVVRLNRIQLRTPA
jgi:hypothetical protein